MEFYTMRGKSAGKPLAFSCKEGGAPPYVSKPSAFRLPHPTGDTPVTPPTHLHFNNFLVCMFHLPQYYPWELHFRNTTGTNVNSGA